MRTIFAFDDKDIDTRVTEYVNMLKTIGESFFWNASLKINRQWLDPNQFPISDAQPSANDPQQNPHGRRRLLLI